MMFPCTVIRGRVERYGISHGREHIIATFEMNESGHHIRCLGFETGPTGGRRLEHTITSPSQPPRRAAAEIPFEAFKGPHHLTFQDAAFVGSERLRAELEQESDSDRGSLNLVLALEDIGRFRPRHRAATKRA